MNTQPNNDADKIVLIRQPVQHSIGLLGLVASVVGGTLAMVKAVNHSIRSSIGTAYKESLEHTLNDPVDGITLQNYSKPAVQKFYNDLVSNANADFKESDHHTAKNINSKYKPLGLIRVAPESGSQKAWAEKAVKLETGIATSLKQAADEVSHATAGHKNAAIGKLQATILQAAESQHDFKVQRALAKTSFWQRTNPFDSALHLTNTQKAFACGAGVLTTLGVSVALNTVTSWLHKRLEPNTNQVQ